jgi:predicted dehydrogenase
MTEPRTRWGIAGTGWISRTTIKDLRLVENLEVVAVSSRQQETADAFAAEEGIERAYGDYARMLEDPDIDVIYIGTPHGSHFPMAVAALEAGKHVLGEKPLGVDAGQARELAALARQRGLFLMEAMWMKFNPMIRTLQKTVAEGAIGELRWMQAGFGFAVPYDPANRFWDPEQGGGALLDVGIYPITLTQLFTGPPDRITSEGTINPDGVDKRVLVNLTGGEVRAQLSTSIEHMLTPRATLAGTTGFIEVDIPFWVAGGFTVWPDGFEPGGRQPYEVRETIEGVGYVPMFRHASQCVLDGLRESPLHPLSATVEVLDTIDEVRRQLLAQA